MEVSDDGKIDYGVFILAASDRQKLITPDTLDASFKMFDTDEKGNITRNDFNAVFTDQTMWNELMRQIEEEMDDRITKEQFK